MHTVPTSDVSGVNVLGTRRRILEPHGRSTSQQTAAASLIRAMPTLLIDQQLSDDLSDYPIPKDILQVPFEFESSLSDSLRVKGNLKYKIQFWHHIGAPSPILSIVRDGYTIPFEHYPPGIFLRNQRYSLTHAAFVADAISKLLQSHRVVELSSPPCVVNALSVSVQANGKKRHILDLRHVDQYLQKHRVKYQDWKVALSYFQKGSYMISFDLKSGYPHIDTRADYQQFLGFAGKWSDEPSFRFFAFTVLPFGLASAPHVFIKCLRLIEKYFRFQGVRIALFVDDGWFIENSLNAGRILSCKIKKDLYKLDLSQMMKNLFGNLLNPSNGLG